ncbi:hypothetical protein KL918_004660 [Ogataea parapolymorpha]|nr:hypothetical protein KL918_004660 [Ogataea parapolymorpha]KAG7873863.1 hypothetical protein KL916_002023 [Ogataea parapolymorpha]KAG7876667.1 hypothetical protein KL938_004279 [Ogataea parapolymorpha]
MRIQFSLVTLLATALAEEYTTLTSKYCYAGGLVCKTTVDYGSVTTVTANRATVTTYVPVSYVPTLVTVDGKETWQQVSYSTSVNDYGQSTVVVTYCDISLQSTSRWMGT